MAFSNVKSQLGRGFDWGGERLALRGGADAANPAARRARPRIASAAGPGAIPPYPSIRSMRYPSRTPYLQISSCSAPSPVSSDSKITQPGVSVWMRSADALSALCA